MINETKNHIPDLPLKKLLLPLTNNKGSMLITVCVVIILVTMLIALVLIYSQIISVVNYQKDDVRQRLDDYLALCAIDEYNAIKQGAGYADVMSKEQLVANAYGALGFGETVKEITYGDYKCAMSNPTITTVDADGVRLQIKYDLKVTVFGKSDITIPMTVTGKFIRK